MKRALILLIGALVLASPYPADAQAPTVTFGGQMRIYGWAFDNITDFRDSQGGANRDSNNYYEQRWRLWTTVESADKKAKAVWGLEVGDIVWGTGGGASGGEYRGCPGRAPFVPNVTVPGSAGSPGQPPTTATVTQPGANVRVGNGAGGCLGADGVNVETKHAYLFADTSQWVPGSSLTIGIQDVSFMEGPLGSFTDDDAAAIKINLKFDPVDVEAYTAKVAEGVNSNADDTDMYVVRVGVSATKDLRITLEGIAVDEKSLAGQSFGDTFWVGATAGVQIGDLRLDGAVVYGQRALARAASAGPGDPFSESGFGGYLVARMPVGSVQLVALGWYTTGDDAVGPAACAPGSTAGCGSFGAARTLTKDSDKLPVPIAGASWFSGGAPYIAEFLFGNSTIGNPFAGQVAYADPSGTWGVGASATYTITPSLSVGGGVAFVGASDAAGPYGDSLFEIDTGANYRFNPNLIFNLFAGFLVPESGDDGWAVAFRTQYSF
jgi:hypothetical protein